nr:DUF368 domain-containing protein [Phytoactinopolyspora alkaliphila]
MIGTVETVPGVSGGTVALVVGVYETVITSAGHFLSGLRRAVVDIPRGRGAASAAGEFRKVSWRLILPLLAGMVIALVVMARLLEGWVEENPVHSRALFFGLVLASLWVPFSLAGRAGRADRPERAHRAERAGREPGPPKPDQVGLAGLTGAAGAGRIHWGWRDAAIALLAAALTFVVVSIPPSDVEAERPVIVLAGAVAVSALVLPGLSGSFLLLTFGLYDDTLAAVNDRDVGYLAFFMLGAAVGLASFVKLLQWLLEHHRRFALVILTGVMAGCLRALWPWQDEDRALHAPDEYIAAASALAAIGFAAVLAFLLAERRWAARRL